MSRRGVLRTVRMIASFEIHSEWNHDRQSNPSTEEKEGIMKIMLAILCLVVLAVRVFHNTGKLL
jgi:hypothetical protein